MLFNDLFESDREPYQKAIDKLEVSRINALNAKMDDLSARGRVAHGDGNHDLYNAIKREWAKCKAERDSIYGIKEGTPQLQLECDEEGNVSVIDRIGQAIAQFTAQKYGSTAFDAASAYAATKFKNASVNDIASWGNAAAKKRGPVRLKPVVKKQSQEIVVSEWRNSPEGADPEQKTLKKVGIVRRTAQVDEMDKSAEQPGRDGHVSNKTYGSRDNDKSSDKESQGKPTTAKQAAKDALATLNKQEIKESANFDKNTILKVMDKVFVDGGGGNLSYMIELKAPTLNALRDKYHDDLDAMFTRASKEELAQAAQELRAMYGQVDEAAVNPQFINAQVTKILAGEARRMTNAPIAQLLAPVMKEYGLTLQQIDSMIPGGLKKAAGEYGIMMKEGFQDFNKVEPYAVCLAGKPVKKFDYYEEARRFHDNWKQKLYREGNKEKADKITLMPLNLDEATMDPEEEEALKRKIPWMDEGFGDTVKKAAKYAMGGMRVNNAIRKHERKQNAAVAKGDYTTAKKEVSRAAKIDNKFNPVDELEETTQRLDPKCWDGYKKQGTKMKGGVRVNNCVPKESVEEDWQKANKKDKTDGMSAKAVNAYRRDNPGSKLQTAVTTKPSKLKKGSKDSKRRSSYCARSKGQKDMHNIDCTKTPDKAICKARKRWNCEESVQEGYHANTINAMAKAAPTFKVGDAIWTRDQDGKPVSGEVIELRPGTVVFKTKDGRRFRAPEGRVMKRVHEGSMADAEQHSSGAKFGGYWKGTDKNPPKPGQGFGGMEESEEKENPMGDKELAYLIAKAKGMKSKPDPELHQGDEHEMYSDNDHVGEAAVQAPKSRNPAMMGTTPGRGTIKHKDDKRAMKQGDVKHKAKSIPMDIEEGAKVDRMVQHIKSSEKAAGKSAKDAESIAWATANKRGYLDNANKKKHTNEGMNFMEWAVAQGSRFNNFANNPEVYAQARAAYLNEDIYGGIPKISKVPTGAMVSNAKLPTLKTNLRKAKEQKIRTAKALNKSLTEVSEAEAELQPGQYYVWTVHFDDGTESKCKVTSDQFDPKAYYAKKNKVVIKTDYDWTIHG